MRSPLTSLNYLAVVCLLSFLSYAQINRPAYEPDPSGSNYSNTVAARPRLNNVRGETVRHASMHAEAEAAVVEPTGGSDSYNDAISLLHLPGRNGLDLDLTLYYNSRVWTIDANRASATFNADRDFPSYGFRLGFGYLEWNAADNVYILTERDGAKRQFTYYMIGGWITADLPPYFAHS